MTGRDAAARMRAQGMSYPAIGAALGVAGSTVYRWLNPAYAEQQRAVSRAWKDAHPEQNRARDRATQHRPCPDCGQPMGRGHSQCMGCRRATETVRYSLIEGMWAGGWTCAEIAAALDTTVGVIGPTMAKLRRAGWDLPYRRTPAQVERIRAGIAAGRARAAA